MSVRTEVAFALLAFAHLTFALLSHSHCCLVRTVGIRTSGFALVSFALLSFAPLSGYLHFPLPKIRTSRFSLHTSRLSLHGEVTIVALKIAMSSHFPVPKFFSPSFKSLFPLFQMARAARRVIENPGQMIKSYPVLFCSSHRKNESNYYQKLLEMEKEIVREVALGDTPYLRKSTDRKAQIRKAFVQFSGLICALRSVDFLRFKVYHPEPPHAQSLFLFPIVFGINTYWWLPFLST